MVIYNYFVLYIQVIKACIFTHDIFHIISNFTLYNVFVNLCFRFLPGSIISFHVFLFCFCKIHFNINCSHTRKFSK